MAVSQEEFRRTLGHFATGVTVITVVREGELVHGMTANAFCSVSLEPPYVLVCVDHRARSFALLKQRGGFGVNVLREEQEAVARYFADPDQDHETARRLGVHFHFTERGTPLLADCLAQLECTVAAAHEAGDHTVFIGRVEEASVHEGRPLLFYGGRYRTLDAGSG